MANCRRTYAGCGTVAGSLARRITEVLGLLASHRLARRRRVASSPKADTTLRAGARSWPLFTNRWKSGAVAPAGYVRIGGFHLDCSVSGWTYEIERSPDGGAHLDGARRSYRLCGMAPVAEERSRRKRVFRLRGDAAGEQSRPPRHVRQVGDWVAGDRVEWRRPCR